MLTVGGATPMAAAIPLMSAPVRVTAATKQDLRLAVNVAQFNQLEFLINIYEGTDVACKIITGMQTETYDGWQDLGLFTATLDANSSERKTMTNPLAYILWQVTSSGNATFFITGVARQT